jgi:hypothetical protein
MKNMNILKNVQISMMPHKYAHFYVSIKNK